jgi:hypothetical protein
MERVLIPKTLGRKSFIDPSPAWGHDAAGMLFIRCKCGRCMNMDEHTVDGEGNVNPSLFHDEPCCGWHVWGKLDEWITS